MLTITDKAAALIGEVLDAARENDADVFRLSRVGQDLGLAVDEERDGDQVVQHEERRVLVIELDLALELDGITIDAIDAPDGQRLMLLLPDEQQEETALA
jgi:Fe-S cluster assembly iron-binding protein IscA